MALHNVRRERGGYGGRVSWRLFDAANLEILIFAEFCRSIADLAYATRLRYMIVVARFIDYLYEVGVLGGKAVTRGVINDSIEYYRALLKFGENIKISPEESERHSMLGIDMFSEKRLKQIAKKLKITPLSDNSWDNTLAALNNFLRLNGVLQQESSEISLVKSGLENDSETPAITVERPLIESVAGVRNFSQAEISKMKQSSLLGSMISLRGEITRPRGLVKSKRQELQVDIDSLDFPEEYFPNLMKAATYWRDCAMWSLQIGAGPRRSEVLNLKWGDIDFRSQEVFIVDPELRIYGLNGVMDDRYRRGKGRTTSVTYFRRKYRSWFFSYLKRYREEEYSLPKDGNDFVFQYLIRPHRGRPLLEASDESLNSCFKSAVARANVPGPRIAPNYVWTSHSLRHSFGRYMLNDFKVPGQERPGVTLVELQTLLGQKDINATKVYGKPRSDELEEKLNAHELTYATDYEEPPGLI